MRAKTMSIIVDVDITQFHKFKLKVCFSESARKMMQNGGRVVAIGPIFVVVLKFDKRPQKKNLNREEDWTKCSNLKSYFYLN